jgi:truncated hemoglobin YjbI
MPTSIFDALGGDAAVAAAVDGLYDRLIPDPLTGRTSTVCPYRT